MQNIEEKLAADSVVYVMYRDAVTHDRWIIKKLVWLIIVAFALLFISNIAWLIVWNQYDVETEQIETNIDSEGDGIANYTGGDGGVIIGESDSPKDDNEAN